jgi:hypothetical protein
MESTTDTTRKLILALEGVAIVTALVLILVDYKLKNDLVDLYKKMEAALADGRQIFGPQFAPGIDTSSLRASPMVRPTSPVETGAGGEADNRNGKAGPASRRGTPANRKGRNRDITIPEPDKPLRS